MKLRVKDVIRLTLPRAMRTYRILSGPLRGRAIVTSLHDYPAAILGTTERSLLGWMDSHVKRGETWLDIGAHYGYTTLALSARVGPQGRVFAFEPVVATAGCIARTRAINEMAQITIVPLALSDNACVQLQRTPLVRGMADTTARGPDSESFLAASLDWLWPQLSADRPRIDGVKIDVQTLNHTQEGAVRGRKGCLDWRLDRVTMTIATSPTIIAWKK